MGRSLLDSNPVTLSVTDLSVDDAGLALDSGFRPLARASWYKRAQAWLLGGGNRRYEELVGRRKRALFAGLQGTVVEIGPGGGVNLPYFQRDVHWVGVEPNPYFRPHLERVAAGLDLSVELRTGTAERLPFPDGSVNAVVSSLVLCSVRDLDATLREIRRVLRPGGSFAFIEHVAAPRGSSLRWVQGALRPAWVVLGDGCHPNRDTALAVERAGFRDVDIERFDVPIPVIKPHIAGVARVR